MTEEYVPVRLSHLLLPSHTWQQPWMREPPAQAPETPALLLEINDVRVHSASTRTALVIPPESRIRRGTITDRLYSSTRSQLRIRNARNPPARKSAVKRLAREYRCTPGEVEKAIAAIDGGYPLGGTTFTAGDLLADEYQALIEEVPDFGKTRTSSPVQPHEIRPRSHRNPVRVETMNQGVTGRSPDTSPRESCPNRRKIKGILS